MNLNNLALRIKPEKTFLLLAFIFGILFTFITPPFEVGDEPNYFYRTYELSEGRIVGKKINNESGDYIPKDIISMTKDLTDDIPFRPKKKFQVKKLKKYISGKINFKDKQFIDFRNTVLYSPVVYIPQVTGMLIAKMINISPLLIFYLGRLFNLFAFIAMIYLSIKITPIYKWGFTVLGLMPMTLNQAASLAADPVCIGISFLFIAFILNLSFTNSEKITNKQIGLVFLMSIVLGLCKSAYFLLPLLFLLIPLEKIGSKKKYFISLLSVVLISAIASISWTLAVKTIYVPFILDANPDLQLQFIFSHPMKFLSVLLNLFNFAHFHYIDTIYSFIGNLGWLDNLLPKLLLLIFLDVIILTALFDNSKNLVFSLKQRIVVFVTLVLNFVIIDLVAYLLSTEVGSCTIEWLIGRYFIPISPLFLLPFYNKFTNKMNILNRGGNIFLVCFIIFMLIITLIYIIKRYYLV